MIYGINGRERGGNHGWPAGVWQGLIHHCVLEGKLDALRILLEHGANANLQDAEGVTCMNITKSMHGLAEFAELLLKHGADPTIKDNHGKTYMM